MLSAGHGTMKAPFWFTVRHMDLTPSPASMELLDQLLQRKRWMRVFAPGMATRTQVLNQLATMTSPALVPHLAIFGMVANSEERRQANAIVGAILDALNVREFLEFDRRVRDSVRMSASGWTHWATLKAWDLRVFRGSEATAAAIICAVSFHASGHVREAAVRLLDEVETGAELRFIARLSSGAFTIRDGLSDAVRYWEPRRWLYNAALAVVVLVCFSLDARLPGEGSRFKRRWLSSFAPCSQMSPIARPI